MIVQSLPPELFVSTQPGRALTQPSTMHRYTLQARVHSSIRFPCVKLWGVYIQPSRHVHPQITGIQIRTSRHARNELPFVAGRISCDCDVITTRIVCVSRARPRPSAQLYSSSGAALDSLVIGQCVRRWGAIYTSVHTCAYI